MPTDATVSIIIAGNAVSGPRTVTMTTGTEVAALVGRFSVGTIPAITGFSPTSAPVGTLITVTGTNLQPTTGTAAQFTLAQQGGGSVTGFVTTASAASVTFIVPAGAATSIRP